MTVLAEPTSSAVTQGIRVTVTSTYVAERSTPERGRYFFAYSVVIANEGAAPAQLRTRHWIITDGAGKVEEVKGDGVVGKQPRLGPGERFQYTSGCELTTPVGTMHGTSQLRRDDGTWFDATIAPFSLAAPTGDERRLLN
jgi:ApaG protein